MIVRISTEGQYRIPGALLDELNNLDNKIVSVVAAGDRAQFQKLYNDMLSLVRKKGKALGQDELVESEIILPPPDIDMEDARNLFNGDGLFPD